MEKDSIEEINLYTTIYRGKETPTYVCYECGEEIELCKVFSVSRPKSQIYTERHRPSRPQKI